MFAEAVIARELKVLGRRKLTYWIRCLYFIVPAAYLLIEYAFADAFSRDNIGPEMFSFFAFIQLLLIFLVVPGTMTGLISDERKKNSLGILYLTPLSAFEIIWGKYATSLLNIFLITATGIPVMFSIMLFGGIDTDKIYACGIILTCTVILVGALSIFFSTSSMTTSRIIGKVYSLIIGWFIVFPIIASIILVIGSLLFSSASFGTMEFIQYTNPFGMMIAALEYGSTLNWAAIGIFSACHIAASSILIALASRRLHRETSGRKNKSGKKRNKKNKRLREIRSIYPATCSIVGNPVAWRDSTFQLQLYPREKTRRIIVLAAMIFFVLIGFFLLLVEDTTGKILGGIFLFVYYAMALVMGIRLIVSASRTFTEEKENGTLELLLTTGLTDSEIIWGKIIGVFKTYRPYIICYYIATLTFIRSEESFYIIIYTLLYSTALLTVYIIWGVSCSLSSSTAIRATTATFAGIFLWPTVLSFPSFLTLLILNSPAFVGLLQLAGSLFICFILIKHMKRKLRINAMKRS